MTARVCTAPKPDAVRVTNRQGWVAMLSGTPLPPTRPALMSWYRAGRPLTVWADGSRRLPHAYSTPSGMSAVERVSRIRPVSASTV